MVDVSTHNLLPLNPRWDDVTHDGDLAYLPDSMPSVIGQRLMAEAFPGSKAKSQLVVVVQRPPPNRMSWDDFMTVLSEGYEQVHVVESARPRVAPAYLFRRK